MQTFLSLTSSSSRQMKKRSMSTLSSTSSTCGSFRYCGSVLPYCAISVVAWYLCATICYAWCLRNWCLWQHLRRVMSLRNYCYAWCLRNWCLWQHQHLSTLLQGKYRVIAETWQITMKYVFLRWARLFFRDERGYSHNEELRFQWRKADLIETEKHGRLLKVLGNCVFYVVLESYAVQAWGLLWCVYSDG